MSLRHFFPAIALAALASSAVLAASVDIGRIKIASGIAVIERGGQKLSAAPGMTLQKGDVVTTGMNGRVGVTFNDNTRIAAGPNSRLSIADYAFDDTTHEGQFLTQIDKGTVAIVSGQIAKSGKDAMRVKTPTALLGVRGTRFVVQVN